MPKVTVLPNVRSVAPRLLAESALIMAFVTVLAGAAFANTLKANCADPSTDLQALIDRANTGDRILISGTCVGHFEVPDQTITLHGLGKNATLDGNNQGVVLNVGNYFGTCCADVKVFGLIVRNGDCGISTAFGSTTTLTNSTVTNNRSWGIETFMGNMTISPKARINQAARRSRTWS